MKKRWWNIETKQKIKTYNSNYKYSTMSHFMAILGHEAMAAPRLSVNSFWKIGKIAKSTSFSSDSAVPSTFGVLCTWAGVGFLSAWFSDIRWWWWWWWWCRWCWWLHLSRLFSDTDRWITDFSSSVENKKNS